jgi:hypothetical protein
MEVSNIHQSRLDEIKDNIKESCEYFEMNVKRFQEFMKFVFDTALSPEDLDKLQILQKPAIEFNILEAMISRLRGEFAKQEPGITVRAADGVRVENLTPELIQTLQVVEAHLREIFFDAANDSLEYDIYSEALGGGYSVAKVYTDYINEMSFEQKIVVDKVFDPTLTGFDPLARKSHKGDGRYCFEIYPKTKNEFIEEFGAEAAKNFKFARNLGDFNWTYLNEQQEIVLVCDYFEKKIKKVKIVKLSNGHIITKRDYKKLIELWENSGTIEQAPIVLQERDTELTTIVRYRLCDDSILEYAETDYKYLPLVFIDGNSASIKDTERGPTRQKTRPYVYHALGVQRLKNFSGQTVGAEIENMVSHKFKVAKESIPEEYTDAYSNVQQADVLIYNAFMENRPDVPLPPPMEIQRTPTPPIVESTFMGTDQVTQVILGSYDAQLGINGNQISGVAIQQGAMQSNAAAIPYLMGYVKGLNRIAEIVIDLIPKYYVTPRSLPIMKSNGKRSYQIINHGDNEESIDLRYNPNDLQVKIEAGVSAAVQKQVALDQIIRMMGVSEDFSAFINAYGLETILDNMDIRGIDALKEQSVKYMEMKKQAQEAQAQKGDPIQESTKMQVEAGLHIEMAKIEERKLEAEMQNSVATAKVAIDKQKADTEYLKLMAVIEADNQKALIAQEKVDSENARSAVESAINVSKHHHERSQADEQGKTAKD